MDRKLVVLLCLSSVFCMITFVAAYIYDGNREWKVYQREYYKLQAQKEKDPEKKKIYLQLPIAIKQINVDRLDNYDRCTTCHLGVEKKINSDEKQPYSYHPNHDQHPFQNFGCTICHEGQGLATTVHAAHGPIKYWDKPLLSKNYLEASCGKCHFPDDIPVAKRLVQGRKLFEDNGCRGCHKLYGKGGIVGPDLSTIGRKESHGFDFKHIKGKHSSQQWIYEHFRDPGRVTPDTAMQNINFSEEDAHLLTVYMLSLRGQDIPEEYIPARSPLAEPPQTGEKIFSMYCRACHSKNGKGSTTLVQELVGSESEKPLEIMVPSLNNLDVQDTVSDEFLRNIITYGRPKTNMNAWGTSTGGGLSFAEIEKLVDYIRHWLAAGADLRSVSTRRGDVLVGREFFKGKCAFCHGVKGEGGIGVSLNAPMFLSIATDKFLARTIVYGRPNTAMSGWRQFDSQEVSDIIAFIRTWQQSDNDHEDVLKLLASRQGRQSFRSMGKNLFEGNCRNCHGAYGQGDLGPTLSSQDFLRLVDNTYLYNAITSGRPGAGMPAWKHLPSEDVAALIGFVRSWQVVNSKQVADDIISGDRRFGRVLYNDMCSGCHGNVAQGSLGVQLNNPIFLGTATNGMLREWIANGKSGTPMRGFGKGSHGIAEMRDDEITNIITYLRYLEQNPVPALKISPLGRSFLGKRLYTNMCEGCHGKVGQGASSGPALSNRMFLQAASDGFLTATLAVGRDGTPMRPVTKSPQSIHSLTSAQVHDIVSYVRSWDKLSPVTGIVKPLSSPGNTRRGKQLYESACAGCHGINGRAEKALKKGISTGQVVAPSLNNVEFLATATDGYLHATIIRGRRGTAMRPFGRGTDGVAALTEDDIHDIIAYIRAWERNLKAFQATEIEILQKNADLLN